MDLMEEIDLVILEATLSHRDPYISLNEVIEYRIRKVLIEYEIRG